mgnify:CR=1 FL=1
MDNTFVAAPLKKRRGRPSSASYDITSERVQTVIAMVRRRATLQEVGDAIGVTREGARKVIAKIAQRYGAELLEPNEKVWNVHEAARELGISDYFIKKACDLGKVSFRRRGERIWLLDEAGMKALRQRFSPEGERTTCVVCGKEFFKRRTRKSCSNTCSNELDRRSYEKTVSKEPSLESLRGWRNDVWEKLQSRLPTKHEEWIGVHEAVLRSGLSPMQINWLGRRRVVATRPHPEAKWRVNGKSITLYAASEIEIARQVFESYEQKKG